MSLGGPTTVWFNNQRRDAGKDYPEDVLVLMALNGELCWHILPIHSAYNPITVVSTTMEEVAEQLQRMRDEYPEWEHTWVKFGNQRTYWTHLVEPDGVHMYELEIALALTRRQTPHFIGPLPSLKFVVMNLPVYEVEP